MITCRLAVCAERVIKDATTGNVSAIHILDAFTVESFPAFTRMMCLLVFDREGDDPEEEDIGLSFRIAENVLFEGSTRINFEGGIRHRQILTIDGFPIPLPGLLQMEVTVGDAPALGWSILVRRAAEAQIRLALDTPSAPPPVVKGGEQPNQEAAEGGAESSGNT